MEKYKKVAYLGISAISIIVLLYLFFKYAFGIIVPFAFAYLIVALARPLINGMCKRRKIPKPLATIFVVSIILFLFVYLLSISISYGIDKLGEIVNSVLKNLDNESNFLTDIFAWIENTREKLPFLNSILPGIDESIYSLSVDMIADSVKSLSSRLTSIMAGFITGLPSFVITLFIILLALFYFSKDYDKISGALIKILPRKIGERLPAIKNDIMLVISKYLRSYFFLFLITFTELFVGFLILGVKGSFLLSILVSALDMLPVLGTGAILIPWGIIQIIRGNLFLGIGLIVLYVIIYVVRQIAEPRILSAQMNVHPLITIFALYAGFKLAGILGMIVSPFLTFIIKTIYKSIKKEKNVENQVEL